MLRYSAYLGIFATMLLASASASMATFLQGYNVSQSVIAGFSYVNITHGNAHYSIIYKVSDPYLLVNTTSNYSFVTNTSDIYGIIRSTIINRSIAAMSVGAFSNATARYLASSSASLNSCLTETGLDRSTCTVSNYCNSCTLVPSCNRVLYGADGPTGAFGEGIMQLEAAYANLTNNTHAFYSAANSISKNSVAGSISSLSHAFSEIYNITENMPDNPVFPPPASADMSQCNQLGPLKMNVSTHGPWYCNAVGYCGFLTYNYTLLTILQGTMSNINNLNPTNQSILATSERISGAENVYAEPLLYKAKGTELSTALNTTLSNYSAVTNETKALLSHIYNETLSDNLNIVEANYSYLLSGYLTINITEYAALLSTRLSALSSMYSRANATYSSLTDEARENTALLLADQLGGIASSRLSSAAFTEAGLNRVIGSSISNTLSLKAGLDAVHAEAVAAEPTIGVLSILRGIDGPFSLLMARALSLNYSEALSYTPLFSALLSLIIGLVIMLLVLAMRLSLKKKGKLAVNKSTAKAWRTLFILIALLVLVYAALTYALAGEASASAGISSLSAAIHSSRNLAVILNISQGKQDILLPCAEKITAAARSLGKSVELVNSTNGMCSYLGTTESIDSCLNAYAAGGIPAILLSYANTSSINIYSMYGTRMSVAGNSTFMNACYAALLVR